MEHDIRPIELNRTKSIDILDKANLTIHQKILLDGYLDKAFMMSILCDQTKIFYYNLGNKDLSALVSQP